MTEEALSFNSVSELYKIVGGYKINNLAVDSRYFREHLLEYVNEEIAVSEKYISSRNQNPHMVKFFWRHDHDFGYFKLSGLMGTRHIWLLSRMLDHFGLSLNDLAGKTVLDVGCWTGGVSLILSKLAAEVYAIDEIHKYVDVVNFLSESFDIKNLYAKWLSLYEVNTAFNRNKFDFVFCFGVIYHLTDPLVGLRRIYNSMAPGGLLCIETMSHPMEESVCIYEGPSISEGICGWNYFIPSPKAFQRLLQDAGFEVVHIGNGVKPLSVTSSNDPLGENRCLALARKVSNHVFCRAGISVDID